MAALKGAAIFVLSDQHEQSSRDKYRKTCSGAFRELFVEHYVGEQYRHEDTKLVYRNNNACRTVLKRLVLAQPGTAGRKSRKHEEQPCFAAYVRDVAPGAGYHGHDYRHDKHRDGSQSGCHSRISLADTAFCKN